MSKPHLADHMAILQQALTRQDLTPGQMRWHYIRLAWLTNGRNVSATARALGMHRRTLQRALARKSPPRVEDVDA